MDNIKISVVIPTKNEAPTLREIIKGVKKYATEVIVIDGNSTDDTVKIAEEEGVKIFMQPDKGKGGAIRMGIEKSEGDIIVFIDGDGSHDADDIPKLINPIINDTADMVIGSRISGGSDELHGNVDRCLRSIGSAIIGGIINLRWKQNLTDAQNGFRALRAKMARTLDLKEKITTIEQEMTIKVIKKGYRISEVPSHEYERKFGESSIRLRKVWFRYIYSIIKNLF
ncbi:MAG: glycosyltransferase family 2 protein [Sedimentisphaerales bacterium]|nr:glycosyltransferase family 2 protein [Sedimentisphaerales bacterium]